MAGGYQRGEGRLTRYVLAALVVVALAAAAWGAAQIGDADDSDSRDSLGERDGAGADLLRLGPVLPDWPAPTPTPMPKPTASPEPSPPEPGPAAAAAAGPAAPTPRPEWGEPPAPPPEPAGGALVDAFLAGYRAGGGDPAWEGHLVNDVIPCESGWTLETGGYHYGLAQFASGTWESAKCSPDSDWRDSWEQGCAVARWMAAIPGRWGTTWGWPYCWNVWN